MLFGVVGQALTMAILAGVNSQAFKARTYRRGRVPVRFHHFLRHRLTGHDMAVSCRDCAPTY